MCPPARSDNSAPDSPAQNSDAPRSSATEAGATDSTEPARIASAAPVRLGYESPPIDWVYEPAAAGRWILSRTAFGVCVAEHVAVIVLILMMTRGGGREALVCGLCSLGFWIGAIGILIERPRRLTASDLAYVVSAFPLALILGHLFAGCLL